METNKKLTNIRKNKDMISVLGYCVLKFWLVGGALNANNWCLIVIRLKSGFFDREKFEFFLFWKIDIIFILLYFLKFFWFSACCRA